MEEQSVLEREPRVHYQPPTMTAAGILGESDTTASEMPAFLEKFDCPKGPMGPGDDSSTEADLVTCGACIVALIGEALQQMRSDE